MRKKLYSRCKQQRRYSLILKNKHKHGVIGRSLSHLLFHKVCFFPYRPLTQFLFDNKKSVCSLQCVASFLRRHVIMQLIGTSFYFFYKTDSLQKEFTAIVFCRLFGFLSKKWKAAPLRRRDET